jgi:hypothetical protein
MVALFRADVSIKAHFSPKRSVATVSVTWVGSMLAQTMMEVFELPPRPALSRRVSLESWYGVYSARLFSAGRSGRGKRK